MELSLSKSGPEGIYYYSYDDLVFGPFTIEYLLKNISSETMVNNGGGWEKAYQFQELKFKKTKNNFRTPNIIISALSLLFLIALIYKFSQNEDKLNEPKVKEAPIKVNDTVTEIPVKPPFVRPPVVEPPVVQNPPVWPVNPPAKKTKFEVCSELQSSEERIIKIGKLLEAKEKLEKTDKVILEETFYLMLNTIESEDKIESCNLIFTYIRALKKNKIEVDQEYCDNLKKTCLSGN